MFNEEREDRREFGKLLARLQTLEETTEAMLRDCRELQTAALSGVAALQRKGKMKKAEEVASIYAQLVAREMTQLDDLARIRAQVEKLASDIAETDQLEREMEETL